MNSKPAWSAMSGQPPAPSAGTGSAGTWRHAVRQPEDQCCPHCMHMDTLVEIVMFIALPEELVCFAPRGH